MFMLSRFNTTVGMTNCIVICTNFVPKTVIVDYVVVLVRLHEKSTVIIAQDKNLYFLTKASENSIKHINLWETNSFFSVLGC